MLPYILAAALAVLWMLDAFLTVQVLKKKGDKKEANDLMRIIFKRGVLFFMAIKMIVMVFVISVLLIMSAIYPVTAESIMFIFIFIYSRVDWHNYKIWRNRNSNAEIKDEKKIK